MKISDIQQQKYYSDCKQGLRQVVGLAGDEVTYVLVWAAVRQEWDNQKQETVSLLGQQSTIKLVSFASWAKSCLCPADGEMLRASLEAKSIKLSVGELAYMQGVLNEAGVIAAGSVVSFDHTEGRAVSGLQKKGFVVRLIGEIEITGTGAAWLKQLSSAVQLGKDKHVD